MGTAVGTIPNTSDTLSYTLTAIYCYNGIVPLGYLVVCYSQIGAGTLRASAIEIDVSVTFELARGDGRTESYVPRKSTYQSLGQHSPKNITYQVSGYLLCPH